jgi:hypothetical protein
MRIIATLATAFALSTSPAWSEDAGGAVKDFGLIGVWAHRDCAQPASGSNDKDIWTVEADGSVSETDDAGPDYVSHYHFTTARRTGADKLELAGVYLGNNHNQLLVMQLTGNRQRTFANRDTTANRNLIADGALVETQQQTDWYVRCPAEH